ncbi:hypothetical protein Rsub_04556 [Raphidocelis subcapitata]|uniref:Uncharacterized protein n=1 Tax=Raphidocelis subcapitata TaxID=307507 RepID=A0A2V0P0K9_9CHLO|nr:hypothetical protein Rsub_04556 [Raphidocelis subcapitata]|eukprot:GBF92452.1 hypothetical protein Rsub_04556 [Raphidocelis subcapitata]
MLGSLAPTSPLDLPWAAELAAGWDSVPLWAKLTGHSLFVAGLAPEFKGVSWLVHLVLTFCWGFGGGILSSLLIMDPKRAPIALFASNEVGLIYLACWWLVAYCPGGLLERICGRWYVKTFTKSCTSLLRAGLIVARVDLACSMFPGVVAAPLVLGTIAGCGGKVIVDAIKFGWGAMTGAAEMSQPGFASRSAFVAAAAYYFLAHAARAVEARAAAGLVVTALMAHSLLTEPLGRPLDFTEPLADLVHTVCFVPKPGSLLAAAAAAAGAAHASAPAKPAARRAAAKPAAAAAGSAAGGKGDGSGDTAAAAAAPAGLTKPAARRSGRTAKAS